MSLSLTHVPRQPLQSYNSPQMLSGSGQQMSESPSTTGPNPASRIPVSMPTSFEFTRRKRWADLLVVELPEALLLVLSPACKVWYCGNAITDLLGWRDHELVDGDFIELMNVADRTSFGISFAESIRTCHDLLAYARLACKPSAPPAATVEYDYDYPSAPAEVLFEIRARVHAVPSGGVACVFAVATPYPSRTTAMVNTFLELKMENEHLQQRINDLRAQDRLLSSMSDARVHPHASYQMGTFSLNSTSGSSQGHEDGFLLDESSSGQSASSLSAQPAATPDEDGDSAPKKKLKRVHTSDQHVCVTCGRTDSPEWRKGPLGPKTLCNACGLRWAKKVRKTDDGEPESSSLPRNGGPLVF